MFPDDACAQKADDYDWFWFLYERDANAFYSTVVYRPFYMRNVYPHGRTFEASLMPVVFWKYKKDKNSEWKSLFGLVDAVDYYHSDGVQDYDFGIFPLFLYGDSPEVRDRYFFMLPFGGTLKQKLAQDRIAAYIFPGFALFFLFPPTNIWTILGYSVLSLIPVYYNYQSDDYRAWGFFWPFVQIGKGSKRDDFKILPFYAHKYKKNTYDAYSILMIGNYRKDIMKNDSQHTLFVFPFLGRRWNTSRKVQASSLLWPFFSWGYSRKTGNYELNFPWPLVMIQDSETPYIRKRIFFPFYGTYTYNKSTTTFVTPLYFHMVKENSKYKSEYYVNAIVVWYYKRDYHKGPDPYYGESWRYFKIWPLFHFEKNDRGMVSFNFLSLYPFRDADGYELLYQPLWTIFEYRRFESGEKRIGFLFRTYYQRWGNGLLHIKVPLLFTYLREKDRLTKFSLLLSMFGYSKNDSMSRIRIFWIPITIKKYGNVRDDDSALSGNEQDVYDLTELDLVRMGKSVQLIKWNNNFYTGKYLHYSMRAF